MYQVHVEIAENTEAANIAAIRLQHSLQAHAESIYHTLMNKARAEEEFEELFPDEGN